MNNTVKGILIYPPANNKDIFYKILLFETTKAIRLIKDDKGNYMGEEDKVIFLTKKTVKQILKENNIDTIDKFQDLPEFKPTCQKCKQKSKIDDGYFDYSTNSNLDIIKIASVEFPTNFLYPDINKFTCNKCHEESFKIDNPF